MRFTDHPARRAVIIHQTGRLGVHTHFLFERADGHGVTNAEVACGVGQEFRHEEQADPLHARRRIGEPREDEMGDIAAIVMIAGGNENLAAADPIAAVAARFRPGCQKRQIGSCRAFGQGHRAGPFAAHERREPARLEFGISVRGQRLARITRQTRAKAE